MKRDAMRPEIANNLNLLHDRLGDGLDSLGSDTGDQFAQPAVFKALVLKQIAGLNAGGSLPLEQGVYQFGTVPGGATLGEGAASVPRFGLSFDANGIVTLVPPSSGISLDAVVVAEPTTMAVGQVIDAVTARFELHSATPTLNRRSDGDSDATTPMPLPSKGRGLDEPIIQWATSTRKATAQRRRRDVVGPAEINARAQAGPPAILSNRPTDPSFGRVVVGFSDEAYTIPGDRSALNGATKKWLASLDVLASVPVEVDVLSRSVAITGPRRCTRPIATWIALAMAADSATDAIGVMVMARANRNDWSWIDALPHPEVAPGSPLELVVIDEATLPPMVAGNGTIVLIENAKSLPDAIGTVIEVDDDSARIIDRSEGTTRSFTPIGVSSLFALEVAFQMAEHLHRGGGRR